MYTQKIVMIIMCVLMVGSNGESRIMPNSLLCMRTPDNRNFTLSCPTGLTLDKFDIDDFGDLSTIEKFQVIASEGRGPLISIPKNICHLKNLKHLDLSFNQIRNAVFEFSSSCLPELEVLDLSNNFLRKIPVKWISQMPKLKSINLSNNHLVCIPNTMFYNISNIEILDVSSNKLTRFELWLIQIKNQINYSNNHVSHFTNDYNVDLSNYQSNITRQILFNQNSTQIEFDDSIFELYNRCGEITSTYTKILMQAVSIIHQTNGGLLHWRCSCEQYYLQKYILSLTPIIDFSTWTCSKSNQIYHEMCSNQSSFSVTNIKPRFCKINDSEPGHIPEYMESGLCHLVPDLESISLELNNTLMEINLLNQMTAYSFADIIDESDNQLKSITTSPVSQSIENNFQNIISRIEYLLERINTTIKNIHFNSVAILSVFKNNSIYSYSQINQTDSYLTYSTDTNSENSIATITIDQISIEHLLPTDIYIFYYLPSSLFQLAQEDLNIIIVSPIVGIHLPGNSPHIINMSFIHIERQFGTYSCVFWQRNRWNDTGCSHSLDSKSNRHYCSCNHTTSFALIFIPDKTINQTSIPSIIVAIISIICFIISIILSIYRQATYFRHLSITNIFTLLNSIILFLLLTIILIRGYQSNFKENDHCSISQQNLVIATYFFLLSTFASKTFLGICYFLTIFFHLIIIRFSDQWFYASYFLVLLIALIPTIIVSQLFKQWTNFFFQYQGVCWFNSSNIFRFISIPIIIFIGLNFIIICGIIIRLCQFSIRRKTVQINEKRMIISMMIWLALCISLGIGWILGPFLDILIKDENETSSMIKLWFFAMFIGLEGVWVLIVNVIFYVNQKVNKKNRRIFNK